MQGSWELMAEVKLDDYATTRDSLGGKMAGLTFIRGDRLA